MGASARGAAAAGEPCRRSIRCSAAASRRTRRPLPDLRRADRRGARRPAPRPPRVAPCSWPPGSSSSPPRPPPRCSPATPGEEGAAAEAPDRQRDRRDRPGGGADRGVRRDAGDAEQHRRGRRGGLAPERGARTISRIDPKTKAIPGGSSRPGAPTDLAVGAGALWFGTGGGDGGDGPTPSTARSADGNTTRGARCPARRRGSHRHQRRLHADRRRRGAVWATGGGPVARIDPRTGARVATVKAYASRIAAGARACGSSAPATPAP